MTFPTPRRKSSSREAARVEAHREAQLNTHLPEPVQGQDRVSGILSAESSFFLSIALFLDIFFSEYQTISHT